MHTESLISQESTTLQIFYQIVATSPIFPDYFTSSQAPKSHLSVIHEMKNYHFGVFQCELNYLDPKWRGCLSDYLVLGNAANSFDAPVKAKWFHCFILEWGWKRLSGHYSSRRPNLAWWKIPDIGADTTWPFLNRGLHNLSRLATLWALGDSVQQSTISFRNHLSWHLG